MLSHYAPHVTRRAHRVARLVRFDRAAAATLERANHEVKDAATSARPTASMSTLT